MNTKFKLIGPLMVTVSLMLLSATPARADADVKSFGITNSIAANSTLTTAADCGVVVKIDNQDNAWLIFRGTGSTAQSGNITFTFARSMDNVTWETSPQFTAVFALASTAETIKWSQLTSTTIGSAAYVKIVSIVNANTTANSTNSSLKLGVKNIKRAP